MVVKKNKKYFIGIKLIVGRLVWFDSVTRRGWLLTMLLTPFCWWNLLGLFLGCEQKIEWDGV